MKGKNQHYNKSQKISSKGSQVDSHKNFFKLLKQATTASIDPAFKKELEKKLINHAPGFLRPRKPFSFIFNFIYMKKKWSFSVALGIFVLIIGISILKPFSEQIQLPNSQSPSFIIDKAYAAYQEELSKQNPNDIFYQKVLYEVDGEDFSIPARKFIDESWKDEQGNFLSIRKHPETQETLAINLRKANDEKSPYIYENVDNFLLLENLINIAKNQDYKPDPEHKEQRDLRFDILYIEDTLMLKLKLEPDTLKIARRLMGNGFLKFENIQDLPEKVQLNLVLKYLNNGCEWKDENCPTAEQSKKILTVSIDKTSGIFKVTNPKGKELTKEDNQKIFSQLNDELDKSSIGKEIKRSWELYEEQYYCVDVTEKDGNTYKTTLQISQKDPTVYGLSAELVPKNQPTALPRNAVENLERNIGEIEHLRFAPDGLKELFENLKKEKNVEYKEEKKEDGRHYYVFNIKNTSNFSVARTYYFDAKSYRLAKQIIASNDSMGSRMFSMTYLDQKYLSQEQGEKFFNPQSYKLSSGVPLLIPEDKGVNVLDSSRYPQTGCYEYDGTRLAPEKEEALRKSLPKEALERFNEMKKNIQDDNRFKDFEATLFVLHEGDTSEDIQNIEAQKPEHLKNLQIILSSPTEGSFIQSFHSGHYGLDFQAKKGRMENDTKVFAAADGKVAEVRTGYNGGYGDMIILEHHDGVQTLYAHLAGIQVKKGDEVKQGQAMANITPTQKDDQTILHILHFEMIKDGEKINPLPFFEGKPL